MTSSSLLTSKIAGLLADWGLGSQSAWIVQIILFGTVVVVAAVIHLGARRLILKLLNSLVEHTKVSWDDALADHKVFERLTHLLEESHATPNRSDV